jgi:hypothetical protein
VRICEEHFDLERVACVTCIWVACCDSSSDFFHAVSYRLFTSYQRANAQSQKCGARNVGYDPAAGMFLLWPKRLAPGCPWFAREIVIRLSLQSQAILCSERLTGGVPMN